MALSRTWYDSLVDDDGSNLVGTIWNKAAVDALMDAVDAELVNAPAPGTAGYVLKSNGAGVAPTYQALASAVDTVVTSTVTGAQNNWAPGLAGHTLIVWTGAADAAFTGLAGGVAGQRVTVKNAGTFIATFAHQSGSSSAGNKFTNAATGVPTPVAAGGWITYEHNGTAWYLVTHEQGAWIQSTFAAGNYTGNASMVWTVEAADVLAMAYRLEGKTLTVSWRITATSISGTPNTDLLIANAAYGGFVATKGVLSPIFIGDNGGQSIGNGQIVTSGTNIYINKVPATNYAAATNTTSTYGTLTFEVN